MADTAEFARNCITNRRIRGARKGVTGRSTHDSVLLGCASELCPTTFGDNKNGPPILAGTFKIGTLDGKRRHAQATIGG